MHVAWINREGSDDRALAMLAAERDDIIATNNRRDLLRIYTQLEVHNGLIIIVPTAPAEEQCRLFDVALDTVERQDSLINLLIEVHPYGTEDVRNWSKDQPEQGA
jgi:hypothetical protein